MSPELVKSQTLKHLNLQRNLLKCPRYYYHIYKIRNNSAHTLPIFLNHFRCQKVFNRFSVHIGDACASNPCQNQGSCITNADSSYTCTCISAFIGTNCQLGKYLFHYSYQLIVSQPISLCMREKGKERRRKGKEKGKEKERGG